MRLGVVRLRARTNDRATEVLRRTLVDDEADQAKELVVIDAEIVNASVKDTSAQEIV